MEWISVKDRLPENRRNVLACYYLQNVPRVRYIGILKYYACSSTPRWEFEDIRFVVTHWMDLPELPKGE